MMTAYELGMIKAAAGADTFIGNPVIRNLSANPTIKRLGRNPIMQRLGTNPIFRRMAGMNAVNPAAANTSTGVAGVGGM